MRKPVRTTKRKLKDRHALPAPWTPARRCPVCRKAGCLVSNATNPAAAVCRHTESPQPIGTRGWLHVLRDGPTWSPWSRSLARLSKEGTR